MVQKADWFVLVLGVALVGCRNSTMELDAERDGAPAGDAMAAEAPPVDPWSPDASASAPGGQMADGACFAAPGASVLDPSPPWAGACPDAGCPSGTTCIRGGSMGYRSYGCAPLGPACAGTPTCACMGCICARGQCRDDKGTINCWDGTIR